MATADDVDVVVAMVTTPDGATAESIARALVEERLAACCTLLPQVRSIYRWQDGVEQADEVLMLVKTSAAGFDALRARVVELHPYDLPEVVALALAGGHPAYLEWVRQCVATE